MSRQEMVVRMIEMEKLYVECKVSFWRSEWDAVQEFMQRVRDLALQIGELANSQKHRDE